MQCLTMLGCFSSNIRVSQTPTGSQITGRPRFAVSSSTPGAEQRYLHINADVTLPTLVSTESRGFG